MITVTVDLVPHGHKPSTRPLKHVKIWNTGTGNTYKGNYKYEISDARSRVYREGSIEGFQRKSNDVLSLLSIVLEQEGYGQVI